MKRFREILVCLILIFILFVPFISAQFEMKEVREMSPKIFEKNKELKTLNSNLFELNKEYSKISFFSFSKRKIILSELFIMAGERKEKVVELVKENPVLFFNNAFPKEGKKTFPKEVQELIEQEITIEGNIYGLVVDDFVNEEISFGYFIITENNEKFDFYPIIPLDFISDVKVKVEGYQIDNVVVGFVEKSELREEETDININRKITGKVIVDILTGWVSKDNFDKNNEYKEMVFLKESSNSIEGDNQKKTNQIIGKGEKKIVEEIEENLKDNFLNPPIALYPIEHKMLVLLVNFSDSPSPSPFNVVEAHDLIFDGQFQNFYQEQSYGRISFSGDVFGWISFPKTQSEYMYCAPSFGGGENLILIF